MIPFAAIATIVIGFILGPYFAIAAMGVFITVQIDYYHKKDDDDDV